MADSPMSGTQKILLSIPALSGLSREDLDALGGYLYKETYPPGGVIFTEGEPGSKLYLVKSGLVEITKRGADKFAGTVRLARRGPGEIIGEMAVIEEKPRFATAVCVEPSEVSSMSRQDFMCLLGSRPQLALRILKMMITRVKEADRSRLEELQEKNQKLEESAAQVHGAMKELQLANSQLKDALRFNQRLLDVSPYPVVVTSAEMIITYCNPTALSVFGVEPRDCIGHLIDKYLGCRSVEQSDQIARSLQLDSRWDGEVEIDLADERQIFCRVAAALVPTDDDPSGSFLFTFVDETQIRLLQRQDAERERLASKGEMAAEIAHELNNYLAVLSGNTELLPMFLDAGNRERVDRCLQALQTSLSRMQVFTSAMLSSRLPRQQKVRQNFNRYLETQIAFLKPQGRFKKIVMSTELDETLVDFKFDPHALQQVIYNLVINSAEALAEIKNPEPRVTLTTRWLASAGTAELEITDNGPGIDPSLLDKLFQKKVTTKEGGHGIGLMTVKSIIDQHGGTITARTMSDGIGGAGTVFTIQLPVGTETTLAATRPIPTTSKG